MAKNKISSERNYLKIFIGLFIAIFLIVIPVIFYPYSKNSINVIPAGIIVFIDQGDVVVKKDGLTNKITNWGYNSDPVLSPDKTKIAFISKSEETLNAEKNPTGFIPSSSNIWIIDIDGHNAKKLTDHIDFVGRDNLRWLENNRLIYSEGEDSVRLYDLEAEEITTLMGPVEPVPGCVDACGYSTSFKYTPDNKLLVWILSSDGEGSKMRVLNLGDFSTKEVDLPFGYISELHVDNQFLTGVVLNYVDNITSNLKVDLRTATIQ